MASGAPSIKICGTTNVHDAELAAELGAWAVGVIFHPASPRRCRLGDATAIAAALHRRAEVVGVFVNRPLDDVVRIADAARLTMLQLHGDEGPVYCSQLARRTGLKIIKAAPIRTRADLQALALFRTDYHLLDAYSPDLRGGTGRTFDWTLVGAHRGPVPVILSGGLTPENVAQGIAATQPFAVDVASGVEARPGHKDPERLAAFFAAVAGAAAPEPACEAEPAKPEAVA